MLARKQNISETHIGEELHLNKNDETEMIFTFDLVRTVTILKKRLWHRRFLVNFAKFLRKPVFIEYFTVATSTTTSFNSFQVTFKVSAFINFFGFHN